MKRNVLILEDSRTQAVIISKMFERAGFSSVLAHSLGQAITLVTAHAFDLLVLDVFVENANTLERLEEFRKLAPDVPLAIMTAGHARDPDAASSALNKARRARVNFLLPKPFHFEDVRQICEDVDRLRAA